MKANDITIVPNPKEININNGHFLIKANHYIAIGCKDKQLMYNVSKKLQGIIKDITGVELPLLIHELVIPNSAIIFKTCNSMKEEEYILEINENHVEITYKSPVGAYHAVSTLKQIIHKHGKDLPCLVIHDWPDFDVRGIMLDISRNKIPCVTTIYKIVDIMADLKLNHFQLYIEGFSFAYPSFPQVWSDKTPITGEEMISIDRYCKERFIDFVPNQNSFGHMSPWLSRKEFINLAEAPDGCVVPSGFCNTPSGLNPLEVNSIGLLKKMYDDLLPNFDSSYFNVNCDETFDLGQGKSKEQCEKLGKGRVYLDFLMSIYEILKSHGKKMMFWGDIIVKYPELISELPKDVIALEWGYDADQPSIDDCKRFADSNITYYICPGTNTWNSIAGRTDTMKSNLLNAAIRGKKYGATGYINTDWGDGDHWQILPASYPSYCLGAALSWDVEQNQDVDIAAYLNEFVFMDMNNKLGEILINLGNYSVEEEPSGYNGTGIFRTLYYAQLDDSNTFLSFLNLPILAEEYFLNVKNQVESLYNALDKVEMLCSDAQLIEDELKNAMKLIIHGAYLGLYKLNTNDAKEVKRKHLKIMIEDIEIIIKGYRRNWLNRNKNGGLDISVARMETLKKAYVQALLDI